MTGKTKNYNLVDEDWIPVLWNNGQYSRVGIRTALAKAGKIRQIAASNPMDNASLFRFLLVVVHWCKQGPAVDELKKVSSSSGFPQEWIASKLGDKGKPNPDFDLFAKNGGFYQFDCDIGSRDDEFISDKTNSESPKFNPVTDLFFEFPSGTNIAHFHHIQDFKQGICPGCCAIGLIRLSAFASASAHGRAEQKPAGINGATPVYAIPMGESLLKTFLSFLPLPSKEFDAPSWEYPNKPINKETVGPLKALTWQPRKIWLDKPYRHSAPDSCLLCGLQVKLVYRIKLLPGWERPFPKAHWPEDPQLLYTTKKANKNRIESSPISYPIPANTLDAHCQFWRKQYQAIFSSCCSILNEAQTKNIMCIGASAKQALYQDALYSILVSCHGCEQAIAELNWLGKSNFIDIFAMSLSKAILGRSVLSAPSYAILGKMESQLRDKYEELLVQLKHEKSKNGNEKLVARWRDEAKNVLRNSLEIAHSQITGQSSLSYRLYLEKAFLEIC
jgi:hypothetical protein